MTDVFLLDGPLRGQLVPWSEVGSIAYAKPGGGQWLYLIYRCAVFGRELYVAACELKPGAESDVAVWNDVTWEFLASDMAKVLAASSGQEECHTPEVRYVRSSDQAVSGDTIS